MSEFMQGECEITQALHAAAFSVATKKNLLWRLGERGRDLISKEALFEGSWL